MYPSYYFRIKPNIRERVMRDKIFQRGAIAFNASALNTALTKKKRTTILCALMRYDQIIRKHRVHDAHLTLGNYAVSHYKVCFS